MPMSNRMHVGRTTYEVAFGETTVRVICETEADGDEGTLGMSIGAGSRVVATVDEAESFLAAFSEAVERAKAHGTRFEDPEPR